LQKNNKRSGLESGALTAEEGAAFAIKPAFPSKDDPIGAGRIPADARRPHPIRSSSFLALRRAPEKRHEPIARARLPACDLGAYPSLHRVGGPVCVPKEDMVRR
jgi:hypothetical protein